VSAERLIALEVAVADLSALYPVARSFRPLHERAERELLPFLTRLGARLRQARRRGELGEDSVASISTELLGAAAHWNEELATLHSSALYAAVREAMRADDQARLGELIPELLAGYTLVTAPLSLHFPVPITTGRRRPGSSPFLHPKAAADQITALADSGIEPEAAHGAWWESEIRPLVCASDPTLLGTTVALRPHGADRQRSIFAIEQEPTLRIFTSTVRGPFTVVLAAAAEDEWWEAYEDDYLVFRDRLRQELELRGMPVELARPSAVPTTPPPR